MGKGFAPGELAGARALIVDDQEDIRELIAEFLELCGMDVDAAASGNQALAAFLVNRPDVVVSDIGMPDGTGLDFIRSIRTLGAEEGGLTPAIAMSGAASPEECFEAGFHFHFPKPVDSLVLLDAIRDFVRAERTGRAKWSVTTSDGTICVRFDGHVTASDMRAAVSRVAEVLAASDRRHSIQVDLTRLSGFDPSVGAVAQTVVWKLRSKLAGATFIGGSKLAHLVAHGSCLILGIPCRIVEVPPTLAAAGSHGAQGSNHTFG